MCLEPDPRRYDKGEDQGGTYYVDKFLKVKVYLDELLSGFGPGVPMYAMGPSVKSATEYVEARSSSLDEELEVGEYRPPSESAKPQSDLSADEEGKDFGFISLDICGSTALRSSDSQAFDRSYEMLIREMGSLVGHFNGAILKTTGDGFIAYIDHPSFTNLCDSLVDLGVSCIQLLRESINPALEKRSLPKLDVRVGADYGFAVVRRVTVPITGYSSIDVYGDALNRAVKIEQSCPPNEMRIGFDLYKLVHVGWLERAFEVPESGRPTSLGSYKVFRIS